jgi:anti-sigma B factor antagonist
MRDDINGEAAGSTEFADSRISPQLSIEISQHVGRTCVMLYGELDGASVHAVWDRLAELLPTLTGDLVLDIAGLSFLDSTGLSLFITLHKNLESKGQRLIVFSPTPVARRLLEITRLDSLLNVDPTVRKNDYRKDVSEVE